MLQINEWLLFLKFIFHFVVWTCQKNVPVEPTRMTAGIHRLQINFLQMFPFWAHHHPLLLFGLSVLLDYAPIPSRNLRKHPGKTHRCLHQAFLNQRSRCSASWVRIHFSSMWHKCCIKRSNTVVVEMSWDEAPFWSEIIFIEVRQCTAFDILTSSLVYSHQVQLGPLCWRRAQLSNDRS